MEHFFRKKVTRREFLKHGCTVGMGIVASPILCQAIFDTTSYAARDLDLHEAMHYTKIDEQTVRCELCPHRCMLQNGTRGFCRVREPRNGMLHTLVYQRPCTVHIDPIEKKPIFHMLPGTLSFSIATAGCNSRCKYCQNWQISQSKPEDTINTHLSCADVVRNARQGNCRSIAYTYTDPIAFYEYTFDTAKRAQSQGIKNVLVTSGYINPKPLSELCQYTDAANVDLKAYDDDYLRTICAESLEPLLEALTVMKQRDVWVEITNLVVPTLNDDMKTIRAMCGWIREHLGADTPLHFSRFWPMYRLKNLPPTPVATLETAHDVARAEGLNYVYIGNVPGHKANNTYCPTCKKVLIRRTGYRIYENNIQQSRCRFCNRQIAGIWE
jgi:pyruvate formate lyase activating enzyme